MVIITHWSVVLKAADSFSPEAESALENLCRNYWPPLYAYVRQRGYEWNRPRNFTRQFFADLLAKRLLHAVDPTKGNFVHGFSGS